MSAIRTRTIATALRTAITGDAGVAALAPVVAIDADQEFAADRPRFVGIYTLARRPVSGQAIAAGTRVRYEVDFVCWCAAYSAQDYATASDLRDELVGAVEVALLRAIPTFMSGAAILRLPRGGALDGLKSEGGYLAMGEVAVTVEAVATTT